MEEEFNLSEVERLALCIECLIKIRNNHSEKIIMGDKIIRDRAFLMADECLSEIFKKKPKTTENTWLFNNNMILSVC